MAEVDESVVETELESLRLTLDTIYHANDLIDDEMSILNVKVLKKTEEWENYRGHVFSRFQREKIQMLENDIKDLKTQARSVKLKKTTDMKIRELQRKIDELSELDSKKTSGKDLKSSMYPKKSGQKVAGTFVKEWLLRLSSPITTDVPYINIIMIGETGAGKSSFLNTVATALGDGSYVKDTYRSSPITSEEGSTTRKLHLEPFFLNNKHLPIRLYDLPGIAKKKNKVGKKELSMVIDGKIKPGAEIFDAFEMTQNEDILRQNPSPADKVHCILYTIRASTEISFEGSPSLKVMHEIMESQKEEDGIRQFVIITAIDEMGVPDEDLENAFEYEMVTKVCGQVSHLLKIEANHIIPVSNYFGESIPNHAKDEMSLNALWRICISGRDYIQRKWSENYIRPDFNK